MPIPQTVRIDPLDLQKNIAIGISLPFNGPKGPFNSTYSTQDQIKSNLINLILTDKGERVFNPEFGSNVKKLLFEGITEDMIILAQRTIKESINTFIPEVEIIEINIIPDYIKNSVSISILYKLKLSGTSDQVTIEFL